MELKYDMELCPVQLKNWSIESYRSNITEKAGGESADKVTLSTEISVPEKLESNECVIGLKVHIEEESDKYVFIHDCEIRGVYALRPSIETEDEAFMDYVQGDGIQELYSVLKTCVFMMSSDASKPSVVLPSLKITRS